jgi:hypothetical protein
LAALLPIRILNRRVVKEVMQLAALLMGARKSNHYLAGCGIHGAEAALSIVTLSRAP